MKVQVSGVVLAGGKNSRMGGKDKAFIEFNGREIIKRSLDIFKEIFEETLIIANSLEHYKEFDKDIHIFEDIIKDKGPLGGIYTGLCFMKNESGFFVACDMPFLHRGLIERLLNVAREERFDCVIPYADKGIEPLFGVYSKRVLKRLEVSLKGEDFSVREFLRGCNCKYIKAKPEEQISFFNLNTPDALKEMGSLVEADFSYGTRDIKDRW